MPPVWRSVDPKDGPFRLDICSDIRKAKLGNREVTLFQGATCPYLKTLSILLVFLMPNLGAGASYRKSTEGRDVVKNKIYPKRKKVEISPNFGYILNQSYIETQVLNMGFNYFFSENWGFGLDITKGMNSDKDDRWCIENFYNDPAEIIGDSCGSADVVWDGSSGADNSTITQRARDEHPNDEKYPADDAAVGNGTSMGPAYVPIREIDTIITGNLIWTPIYGKALILLSTTVYFDLYLEGGLGLAQSDYYPKQEKLKNGNTSRGEYEPGAKQPAARLGAYKNESYAYGEAGRPASEKKSNVLVNLGIGQKFHFGGMFHVKVFLRDMVILGTPGGFENLMALYAGVGIRF